ncbi:hypothetical protein AZE42_12283, partial [Rhizopogon vesiculosus]
SLSPLTYNINRLELVLRLLDNGSLSTDRVQALKEDVLYVVKSNTDEDFDEYEGIYAELNLEEEEEKFSLINYDDDDDSDDADVASDDIPQWTPNKRHDKDEESVASSKRDDSPVQKKLPVTPQLREPSSATEGRFEFPSLNAATAALQTSSLSQPIPLTAPTHPPETASTLSITPSVS